MAHAWWRDADYALFDRLQRERDAAVVEMGRRIEDHAKAAADNARLREALEEAHACLSGPSPNPYWAFVTIDAALAGTSAGQS
jgi:hypothetical protein